MEQFVWAAGWRCGRCPGWSGVLLGGVVRGFAVADGAELAELVLGDLAGVVLLVADPVDQQRPEQVGVGAGALVDLVHALVPGAGVRSGEDGEPLERGEIPMEQPGRHRYVRLSDLLEYQRESREARRQAFDDMVQASAEAGLYEATDGLPPAMR